MESYNNIQYVICASRIRHYKHDGLCKECINVAYLLSKVTFIVLGLKIKIKKTGSSWSNLDQVYFFKYQIMLCYATVCYAMFNVMLCLML